MELLPWKMHYLNTSSKPLFKSLGLFKFDDLVHYKTTSLLWDVDHGTIPPTLSTYFKNTESRQHHATHQATLGKYQTVKKLQKLAIIRFKVLESLFLINLKICLYTQRLDPKNTFCSNKKSSWLQSAD